MHTLLSRGNLSSFLDNHHNLTHNHNQGTHQVSMKTIIITIHIATTMSYICRYNIIRLCATTTSPPYIYPSPGYDPHQGQHIWRGYGRPPSGSTKDMAPTRDTTYPPGIWPPPGRQSPPGKQPPPGNNPHLSSTIWGHQRSNPHVYSQRSNPHVYR